MTPDVEKYERIGNRIVELSKGTGLDGEDIFGVSEFEYKDSRLDTTKRGNLFRSHSEAWKYYQHLINS